MSSIAKPKKKSTQLSKVLSDQDLQRNPYSSKKKFLSTSRSDALDLHNKKKFLLTSHDSKLIHNINLQIPSLHTSGNNSVVNKASYSKRSACIQGFSSKIIIKSPKAIKKKKTLPTSEIDSKLHESEFSGMQDEDERLENLGMEMNLLKVELQKALHENKKLKKSVQEENSKEDMIDEAMKAFKARLQKLLYE